MSIFAHIALIGWLPVVLALFAVLPPRRAAVVALVGGWLFLPMGGYKFTGLPEYNKLTASAVAILLGTLLSDSNRFGLLRPRLVDVPILVWCLCPIASSVANGLGIYDGLSEAMRQTAMWGLPYMIGRMYFGDLAGLRELGLGILIGGLAYVPLCLIEVRFSPQLHRILYGFHQHSFLQHIRYNGFRPMVFMPQGLALAFWMATCGVVAIAFWRSGTLKQLWGIPMGVWSAVLAINLVLCKSAGPLMLYAAGTAIILVRHAAWRRATLLTLALVPFLYTGVRTSGAFTEDTMVRWFPTVDADRLQSFQFRLHNEDQLVARALLRPSFGWGGWGRARVYDAERRKDISVTDGLWVLALGNTGLVGLTALICVFACPGIRFLRRWPKDAFASPATSLEMAIALVTFLAAINNLPNADNNPVVTAALAGLGVAGLMGPATTRQPTGPYRWRSRRVTAKVVAPEVDVAG